MAIVTLPKPAALSWWACNSKVHDWRLEGATSKESWDNIVITWVNLDDMSIADVIAVVDASWEVVQFPCMIKVLTADMGNTVPAGLPNSEGKTWTTWRDEYHEIQEYLTYSYFWSNPFWTDLTWTEIKIVNDNADSSLLTLQEYYDQVLVNI